MASAVICLTTEQDKITQALEITKLKQRVRKLEKKRKLSVSGLKRLRKVGTTQRVKSFTDIVMDDQEYASKYRGIIADLDADMDVTLEEVDTAKDVKVEKNIDVQGRLEESQAQAYKIDLEHAEKVLSMQDDELEPTELKEVVEVVTTAKLMIEVVTTVAATITTTFTITTASKCTMVDGVAVSLGSLITTPFLLLAALEAVVIVKVVVMVAATVQKLNEEVEELKKHLQIVPNDEDGVYTKATPLALKVPIVGYEIHTEHNKPYYKIVRADGSHQLFLSFLSLLRNFDIEDLEMLWQIVKERFASSKPTNFLYDFLLTILKAMFEKPDVEAQI
uniref:Uncharacterized protein n=1 Tax=Tanacetum cinerariifolium TaxID=118510 RepID=A0A699JML5_TANCI|nr:hypothetical protein [Tanacetum cinerariifolium]